MKNSQLRVLCGNSNKGLAEEIVKHLDIKITPSEIKKFSDGEISVKICESVRYDDVYIVQSTSHPGNDHIMELMLMVDAAMRASARTITVIIPYYGYSRQDRKVEPRVPISAKVIANMLQSVGVNRVITMDLHSDQTQGFFDIPVDNLFAAPIIVDYIKSKKFEDLVIVSPDAGGVNRARFHAKKLAAGLAIVDKRRAKANVSEVMHVIGDVKDKVCILIDDMIDTAGSITGAGKALVENGAREVYCLATHGVLSGPAVERLNDSVFKEVILTNTIPLPEGTEIKNAKVVSVAGLFAEAIKRIYKGESVSNLFI